MMQLGPDIPINKNTGTHADVLLVAGMADLLSYALDGAGVRIVDRQSHFLVRLSRVLTEEDIRRIPAIPGYPFLKTNEKVTVPVGVIDAVDYKAEKAKVDRIRKATKAKQGNLDAETQQIMAEEQIRGDWRVLQVLNTLQGDETCNKVHRVIVGMTQDKFTDQLMSSLSSIAAGQRCEVDWQTSLVQLFTPLGAKGYSRLKPDSTSRNDKTKEQWADSFAEWLRYRGYFRVACPFFQGQKAENIRLLCPIPGDISLIALISLSTELPRRGVYGGTTPKLDALASLRMAQLLIEHSEEYHSADDTPFPGLSLSGRRPTDVVSGIAVTHYQSMGNAKAVSAMSTLSLPGWFPVSSPDDAREWLVILEEHQRAVRGLQEEHSDEIGLLMAYRRVLEGRGQAAAWAFIEFLEHYGPFIMRANGLLSKGRRRWITRFTAQYVRRILMEANNGLLPILDDPGFEAVARAVRQSTVRAQNRKAREKMGGEKEWREVRYDLLHDLHRTRKLPGNAFIERVAEFVSQYNYENARRREVKGDPRSAPANVSDEELKAFVALVDRFRPATVGALLAAYGSCKEKWEGEEPEAAGNTEALPANSNES